MDGKQVKAKREKLGLTRAELARRIGVSIRTVESWEQGARIEPNEENERRILALEKE